MPEAPLDFPRQWIEFTDPDDSDIIIRADLTWLRSRYHCIFGAGCPGVMLDQAEETCCIHGAYLTDKDDEKLVRRSAAELTKDLWANKSAGKRGLFTKVPPEDAGAGGSRLKTRVVDDVCIFFNRLGTGTPYGCSLHHLAVRTGRTIIETKPEVCWQVPIRRDYEHRTYPDGHQVLVTTITEFDRRAWGEGGHDFDWWCSGSPLAHTASVPLVESAAVELTALIGQAAYDELLRLCTLSDPAPHPGGEGDPAEPVAVPITPAPAPKRAKKPGASKKSRK